MERFTRAIRKALEYENWYAALYLSLVMPDICGKLAYPDIQYSGERYKKWFQCYLEDVNKTMIAGNEVVFLTASDCWALRCSVLHEGIEDISLQKARELLKGVRFTTLSSHRIRTEDILTLNVSRFCEEMCQAVDEWYEDVKGSKDVQARINNIVTIRDEGFSPIPYVRIG